MIVRRQLERLTASDIFLLLWDDDGWSGEMGALSVLDGTSLLDPDGHVHVDKIRRHLEPRLAFAPRFRQVLLRPDQVWGGHSGSTPTASTSPTTSASIP